MHPAELGERDAWRSLAGAAGLPLREVGGAVCTAVPATPDVPMLNHVVGLGEDVPAEDDVLDAVAEFYAELGIRYYVCVSPSARPAEIRGRLGGRGFTHGYAWMKFVRGVDALAAPETELEVRPIGASDGEDFARVVGRGFGLAGVESTVAAVPGTPGWSCYIAYDRDEPAAAGALFVCGGDVGWLGLAATLPEHRRKGGQRAILAARIDRARGLGVRTLVTETGVREEGRASNSYRNIRRAGFEEAYVRENYLSPEQPR